MQSFYDIQPTDLLVDSRSHLMDNDKTAISCSSGNAFPAYTFVGQLCFRTDQLKLYQLRDTVPTWILIADLLKTIISKEEVIAGYSQLGHTHSKSAITDFSHGHAGSDIANATTGSTGVVKVGSGLSVDANGSLSVNVASNTVYVNPNSPKNGDIYVNGSVVSVYANGWKQIYPAIYSS
jgi:hypothetical protein